MANVKISETFNGFVTMKDEAEKVMNLISETKDVLQSIFPQFKIAVYQNKYNNEGINILIDNYTLTCQTNYVVQNSATCSSLSFAIYKDVKFNEAGLAVNSDGILVNFPVPENRPMYKEYELYKDSNGRSVWSEAVTSVGALSSEDLVEEWMGSFINLISGV